jgi:hypothetical protein
MPAMGRLRSYELWIEPFIGLKVLGRDFSLPLLARRCWVAVVQAVTAITHFDRIMKLGIGCS